MAYGIYVTFVKVKAEDPNNPDVVHAGPIPIDYDAKDASDQKAEPSKIKKEKLLELIAEAVSTDRIRIHQDDMLVIVYIQKTFSSIPPSDEYALSKLTEKNSKERLVILVQGEMPYKLERFNELHAAPHLGVKHQKIDAAAQTPAADSQLCKSCVIL